MTAQKFIQKIIKELRAREHLAQFLILVSFLVTFIITRIVTYLQHFGFIPDWEGMLHIHHLVPGIILVLIAGYIGISFWAKEKARYVCAVLFGIGAALTIDEFALWLFLKDVYWEKQGRLSVDAVIVTTVLLILGLILSEIREKF